MRWAATNANIGRNSDGQSPNALGVTATHAALAGASGGSQTPRRSVTSPPAWSSWVHLNRADAQACLRAQVT